MSALPTQRPSTTRESATGRPTRAGREHAPNPTGPAAHDPGGPYDGNMPFPAVIAQLSPWQWRVQVSVTVLLVAGPLAAVAVAAVLVWGRGIGVLDLVMMVVLYVVTGLGIAIGYHRGLTHRSYTARPFLRAALATVGAMAFEGDPISWVATHRRHHAFTDRPGDPHSPYRYGVGPRAQTRGLLDAHIGWLFRDDATDPSRWAPDMVSDPTISRIARLFPTLCVASLALPFVLGLALTRSLSGGLLALLWAGLVRVAVLQHVTWSVNSLCHAFGTRPFTTRAHDRASNLWFLAIPSFGESWHNAHHSNPTCARHGVEPRQVDLAASVIRLLERAGLVSGVHWPTPERVTALRR